MPLDGESSSRASRLVVGRYLVPVRPVLVTAPDDTRWTVRVAWEPRWRPLARRFGGWRRKRRARHADSGDVVDGAVQIGDAATSGPSGGGFDFGDAVFVIVVVFIAVIAAAALFWWVLLPCC